MVVDIIEGEGEKSRVVATGLLVSDADRIVNTINDFDGVLKCAMDLRKGLYSLLDETRL